MILNTHVYCYLMFYEFVGSVVLTSGYSDGSGPIFLDQLDCSGSEESLLDCPSGRPVGLHQCDHTMDVGIRCQGMYCLYVL